MIDKILVSIGLLGACLPATAELAVFVDGRVLQVEDAWAEGEKIVLDLGSGARVIVPATRIARVVANEIDHSPMAVPEAECQTSWAESGPLGIPYEGLIVAAARNFDLHPRLLASLVRHESAFDPRAVSRAGAKGLTQLMPATMIDHGVDDPFDPEQNLRGGAGQLRRMLDRFDDLELALAAYNAGATTVERSGGIPPYRETRRYVASITAELCSPSEGGGS